MANKKKKTATTNAGAKSKEQLVIHQIVVKAPQRKVYDVGKLADGSLLCRQWTNKAAV